MITSPHNPRLKNVIKLRDRRPRKQQGLFLIDGVRQIEQALAAAIVIREIYLPESALESKANAIVLAAARGAHVEIVPVAEKPFAKLAYGDRSAGLVAVAETPSYSLPDFVLPDDALILVVEGIEKPGNLGGMLRTADAAGVSGVLVADTVTEVTNPNVVRASMGALFTVPMAQADSAAIVHWLTARKFQVLAARVDGAINYTDAEYQGRVAIVLGSEAGGLSDIWRAESIAPIALPMRGSVDSLNVSVTAAVLLYEAQRQRGC